MPNYAVQRRRGTTAEHSSFTGLAGELTVDTTKDTVVVHDGSTAGGIPLLRQDVNNLAADAISGDKVHGGTISGSAALGDGTTATTQVGGSSSYGHFYPEAGLIIINGDAFATSSRACSAFCLT